jgi:hypothetical protein
MLNEVSLTKQWLHEWSECAEGAGLAGSRLVVLFHDIHAFGDDRHFGMLSHCRQVAWPRQLTHLQTCATTAAS